MFGNVCAIYRDLKNCCPGMEYATTCRCCGYKPKAAATHLRIEAAVWLIHIEWDWPPCAGTCTCLANCIPVIQMTVHRATGEGDIVSAVLRAVQSSGSVPEIGLAIGKPELEQSLKSASQGADVAQACKTHAHRKRSLPRSKHFMRRRPPETTAEQMSTGRVKLATVTHKSCL